MEYLQYENIWLSKPIYDEAEIKFFEQKEKGPATPLAVEVAKTRRLLIESRDNFKNLQTPLQPPLNPDPEALKFLEKKAVQFEKSIAEIFERLSDIEKRLRVVEQPKKDEPPRQVETVTATEQDQKDDDDDVDLFGSDSDEENEAASKIKEERLAAYNAKKSKKPVLIAKSNLILDVKPWDDETDMKALEKEVRKIETDGLLWGASKLVPLAYGIFKLQISCVVEDEKVSIDWLQEAITENEEYVQSVDIAAFNKI